MSSELEAQPSRDYSQQPDLSAGGADVYQTLIESSRDLIFVINRDMTLQYINQFAAHLLGFEAEALTGKSFDRFFLLNRFHLLQQSLEQVWQDGQTVRVEDRLLCPTHLLWLDMSLFPIQTQEGRVQAVLGVARDVTNYKQIEQILRDRTEELRYRATLLQLTLDNAPIGIATCQLTGQFISVNPALCDLLGYSVFELRRLQFQDVLVPAEQEETLHQLQQLMTGEINRIQSDKQFQRQDGEIIQGILRVGIVNDAKLQPLQFVIQIEDVTEQKQAAAQIQASLKEKEILLREVHHRVKNNLQMISGMLTFQTRFVSDPLVIDVLQSSRERIRSIALIHETLYQASDLAQVDFKNYIERLANHIVFASGDQHQQVQIQFELDSIWLNLETAIPCGLLLNELLVNCLKHAFVEEQVGTIKIELSQTLAQTDPEPDHLDLLNQNAQPQFLLAIQDNGIGLSPTINPVTANSLGLSLIRDLTWQLKGTSQFTYQQGTRFELWFRERQYKRRI